MRVGYPDTMNRQEASPLKKMDLNDVLGGKDLAGPLKARYTTTGKRDEIEEVEFDGLANAIVDGEGDGGSDSGSGNTK
tara:strand:- start:981 stop:1214 length:234 start_codon:yes stop_codon:yes gene_type:complete